MTRVWLGPVVITLEKQLQPLDFGKQNAFQAKVKANYNPDESRYWKTHYRLDFGIPRTFKYVDQFRIRQRPSLGYFIGVQRQRHLANLRPNYRSSSPSGSLYGPVKWTQLKQATKVVLRASAGECGKDSGRWLVANQGYNTSIDLTG